MKPTLLLALFLAISGASADDTKSDLVFLIDVTQSASKLYDDMSSFISQLVADYAVNQQFTRISIVPVMGTPSSLPAAFLNSITSQTLLQRYLTETKTYYNDFSTDGQYLQSSLDMVSSPTFLNEGYRSSISNHLLVYITATSALSTPTSTAPILRQNTYGVVTIGYGSGIEHNVELVKLAGGENCSFLAKTKTELLGNVVESVKKLISNGGKYCGN